MSAENPKRPAWMPPPKTQEERDREKRLDGYRRVVRALRLQHEAEKRKGAAR